MNSTVSVEKTRPLHGVQCIFTFLLPDNYFNLTQDNLRKAYIQRIKDRFPNRVFDGTQWTGDGGSPEKIRPEYHAGDNLHANDAGNDVLGVQFYLFVLDFILRFAH